MSNKIKLENPLEPVHLTLAGEPTIINIDGVDSHYVYNANFVAGATGNVINHNLGKYCSVTVVDENDDVIIGEIRYNSINQVTLFFTAAFAGKAYFN